MISDTALETIIALASSVFMVRVYEGNGGGALQPSVASEGRIEAIKDEIRGIIEKECNQ